MQAHGCYLGVPERVNSLFENVQIRENVLKPYLIYCNADPLGQSVLPDTDRLPPYHGNLMRDVTAYLPRVPWAYKDAKLTLVWPIFNLAFPHAQWIIVRRDRDKIVESCMRTDFMRRRATVRKWEQWVDEHERRFDRMRQELKTVEVWTDHIIRDPLCFEPIAHACGLPFNAERVIKLIDHKRWHPAREEALKRAASA
jgi:hypothetical protein